MNLSTVENTEVNEGSENRIIVNRNQNDEAVGAALDEIRTAWVDHPSTPQLISHRHLFRYSQELTVMQITLREYAYSEDNNELDVVNAVFEYVTRAHDVYLNALYSWIEKASAKELEGVSVPALPRIRKLLSQYNPLIKERLKKYHEKAKASIAERCELSSVNSSIMENQSRKAEAYSALRSAKLNKQGIEKETLEMLSSDEEETKDSLIGLEDEERPTRRDALKKVTLDGSITGMPTKGNPELTQQRLKGISTTERISLPSVTPVVTETKKNDYLVDKRLGNCYRAQQESAERRQAPVDHPKSQPLTQRVTTEGEHPINKLELNEFDQAQAGHRQSLYRDNFKPDVGAYRRIGDHPQ